MLAGRRHYASGPTKTDARGKLAELRRRHAVGELTARTTLTVGQHLADWIEAGRAEWKPKTTHEYEAIIRLYLEPAFGHLRLTRLDGAFVERQYADSRSVGKGAGRLLNVHRAFHRAMAVAVRWRRVGRNPLDGVDAPRVRRRRPDLWSTDDAHRFLSVTAGDHWHPAWALLIGTGCRLGEALALEWGDIDLERGEVRIQRTETQAGRRTVITAPKTQAGDRSVTLPEFAVSSLRGWRHQQAEVRLHLGPAWRGAERALTRSDGRPASVGAVRWAFERAGLPHTRIHDLRHLHASMLLASGQPVPLVAARLGHASPAVTMSVYAHALRGQDQAAASVLDAALAR